MSGRRGPTPILCGCCNGDREIVDVSGREGIKELIVEEVKDLTKYLSTLDELNTRVKGFPDKKTMVQKAKTL